MVQKPRERLMATDEIRNDFVSSFKALSNEHVKVELLGGVENTPTITLTAEGYASVQFETDLSAGDEFILYRETEIDASDIYVEGQPLRAASLNAEHSRTSMLLEEMEMRVSDTLHKPEIGDDASLALPSLEMRKNKFLYFDDGGNAQVSSAGSEWVTELEGLKQDVSDAIDASVTQVDALQLPLTEDKIADHAITQEKIDPEVRLGGLSAGSDSLIRLNANVIREDVEFSADHNGMSAGPIRIASKNDLYKSEDLTDDIWNKTDVTVEVAAVDKPDILTVVNKISVPNNTVTRRYLEQVYSQKTALGNVYTMAVYAKKSSLDSLRLAIRTNDTHLVDSGAYIAYANFDLENQEVEEQVETASSGVDLISGTDWYRCWFTSTPLTHEGPLTCTIYLRDLDGSIEFGSQDTPYLYLSGAQVLQEAEKSEYFRSEGDEIPGYSVTVNGVWSIV